MGFIKDFKKNYRKVQKVAKAINSFTDDLRVTPIQAPEDDIYVSEDRPRSSKMRKPITAPEIKAARTEYVDSGRWERVHVYYPAVFEGVVPADHMAIDVIRRGKKMTDDDGDTWSRADDDYDIAVAWHGLQFGVIESDGILEKVEATGTHLQLRGHYHGRDRNGYMKMYVRVPDLDYMRSWLGVRKHYGGAIAISEFVAYDYLVPTEAKWNSLGLASGSDVEVEVLSKPMRGGTPGKMAMELYINGELYKRYTPSKESYEIVEAHAEKKERGLVYWDNELLRGFVYIVGPGSGERIYN